MQYKKIHCLGIGGIGISALARWYRENGAIVTGEDDYSGEVTDGLIDEGVEINIPITGKMLDESYDLLVHTIAIDKDNLAIQKAESLGIKIMTYPEALGEMSKVKRMIAVCGTHGKTTTTAMAYYALKKAGIDVSLIVGSLIKHDGRLTNYIHGESDWMVVETCEYRDSFLNYNPEIIILTNIDNDHLDYFKDMEHTTSSFQKFVNKLSKGSALISHKKYLDMLSVGDNVLKVESDSKDEDLLNLKVPGLHNRQNASLSLCLSALLNLDKVKMIEGLNNFPGTWRRQEYRGDLSGMPMYDDYAHHPTEVTVTIKAFREKYPEKKILVTFQPHLFSRTKLLFNDFVQALALADEVFLLPIYPAREAFDESINSQMLAYAINQIGENKVKTFENLESLIKAVQSYEDKENTVMLNLGAGDAYKMFEELK